MRKRHRRPVYLLAAAALAFGTASYAATGGSHAPAKSQAEATVTPPPNSNGHCGHSDQKPPCKHN